MHHLLPLYMGGGNQLDNLLAIEPTLHRQIHELFEGVRLGSGTLQPSSLFSQLGDQLRPGLAIITKDGKVLHYTYQEWNRIGQAAGVEALGSGGNKAAAIK